MPKVLNIVETKITTRNNVEVQRVIFSDDKIVYVRTDNGEVYPDSVPEKYINLIDVYNASHSVREEPRSRASLFDDDEPTGYITDGTKDRSRQIRKAKNKSRLSSDRHTQKVINRIRSFGQWMLIGGIVDAVVATISCLALLFAANLDPQESWWLGLYLFTGIIFAAIYIPVGKKISSLDITPEGIRNAALIMLILGILCLFVGALGLIGGFIFIYSIIALCNLSHYEAWYYGEIE